MHAYSDAAGKYNPDATRDGNEDNFYVDDNLCDEFPSHCESDVVKELCDLGLIMAVADGMGGMNAGEVASEIAVETIQEFFSPGKITEDIAKDHQSRKKYLERLIVEADARIKNDSKKHPEHEEMGSTIILAWIVGDQLTLSWCGDSRAYRYNPALGIKLLSEDHSYVQELVKQGVLTYDQTFEHPQGNIVTRSLGDETKKAQPETRFFNVYNNDIILLCSDGLSGVLRDRKTSDGEGGYFPGDNLEDIIRENSQSLVECREALWKAAENADWYDNVTAILCEIKSGASPAPIRKTEDAEESTETTHELNNKHWWTKSVIKLSPKSLSLTFIVFILVFAICFGGYKGCKFDKSDINKSISDTVIVNNPEDSAIVSNEPDSDVAKIGTTEKSAPTASTTESNGNLLEKAGSIIARTQVPSYDGNDVSELERVPEELTEASDSDKDSETEKGMAVVESFLLKQIAQGDTKFSLENKHSENKFHKLYVLDETMRIVPDDSLKAGATYMLILLSNSSNLNEFFSLYKTEGNKLYNNNEEEVSLANMNIQTIGDFLNAVKRDQLYTIKQVIQ